MLDTDLFLTTIYVMCDDFCKQNLPPEPVRAGRRSALSRSEWLTLCLFSAWGRFQSEHDFWRWMGRHSKEAFHALPARCTFNRAKRAAYPDLVRLFEHLSVQALSGEVGEMLFEVIDSFGIVVRNPTRRGRSWLRDQASKGYCSRHGWFFGARALLSVTPRGAITGMALCPGASQDQPLCDAFLHARAAKDAGLEVGLPVGLPASVPYLSDKGFAGREHHRAWWHQLGAGVICPPQRVRGTGEQRWPKALRRQHASWREIVETVNDKLLHCFGLETYRPHCLEGLQVTLLIKAALHNFCLLLNRQHGRPDLQFADLWEW